MRAERLPVVVTVTNPVQYRSRYHLFTEFFLPGMDRPDVDLKVVEVAFASRPFVVTEAGNPNHLQLRSDCELWTKEASLNQAFLRLLPPDWTKAAWIDGDVRFQNVNWVRDTMDQLDRYDVVQMFEHAVDLSPDAGFVGKHTGFMASYHAYLRGKGDSGTGGAYGGSWHSGFAWALTRRAWDAMGGLPSFCILGSADRHLACALIGEVERTFGHLTPDTSYRTKLSILQERLEVLIRRNVGYVPGMLLHGWHGRKKDRGYGSRPAILKKHAFCPERHLMFDGQGLPRWSPMAPFGLRDDVRAYMTSRNEDSLDLE